jgi:hypothetical protein
VKYAINGKILMRKILENYGVDYTHGFAMIVMIQGSVMMIETKTL